MYGMTPHTVVSMPSWSILPDEMPCWLTSDWNCQVIIQ